jgi:hypothetical protein
MTRFAALGDSITVGMGDPAPGRGWAALLARTLPQPELHNLATLGALAADVEPLSCLPPRPCGRTWPASWSASTTRSAEISIPNGPACLSTARWLRCARRAPRSSPCGCRTRARCSGCRVRWRVR